MLSGTEGETATIDMRAGATRYAVEIQGEFAASYFKVLQPDTSGIYFKAVTNNQTPLVSQFDNGTFDKGPNTGTYLNFTDGTPVRFTVSDSNLLRNIRFDNSDSVATLYNVTSVAATKLKDSAGLDLSFVAFGDWAGAKGGEPNDNEGAGEDKFRWISKPANLSQTKLDGSTSISVGATTNENGVILKNATSSSDSNNLQLEVEVKATSASFDGTGTQVSSAVSAGSTAQNSVYGLATGTNYHWRARARMGSFSTSWASFGGNQDGSTDFAVSITNNAPGDPSSVGQFKTDDTAISAGGTTNESSVKFKGTVSDPDGNTVKFQVEVKAFSASFDGNISGESALLTSGSQASVTVSGFANGQYKWRYRAVDQHGHASGWTTFPPDSTYDFQVATVLAPPVITTSSHKTKDTTPAVAGTSNASASIEVFANGVSVGTTTADGGGNWSLSTSTLNDGGYSVTAKQTVTPNTSDHSAPITLTIDTCPPAPPVWVSVTPQSGAAMVEWAASTSADVAGYHVYRKLDTEGEGSWTKITTSGPVTTTKYRDTGLTNGTKYNYKITAVDDAQNQ